MKSLLTLLACCLLSAGLAHAGGSKQQIESLISSYETALNGSDINGVLGVYGKNPVFMPQHAPAQVGRDAVKQAYAKVFNTIKLDIKFTTHEIEVLGNTAWARTSSTGKKKILAADVVVKAGNNEIFIFKNEDGSWKIHQYLFSTTQPRQ